jgi:hypothetical protein
MAAQIPEAVKDDEGNTVGYYSGGKFTLAKQAQSAEQKAEQAYTFKEMGEINKDIRKIRSDVNMSPDEKKAAIDADMKELQSIGGKSSPLELPPESSTGDTSGWNNLSGGGRYRVISGGAAPPQPGVQQTGDIITAAPSEQPLEGPPATIPDYWRGMHGTPDEQKETHANERQQKNIESRKIARAKTSLDLAKSDLHWFLAGTTNATERTDESMRQEEFLRKAVADAKAALDKLTGEAYQ